MCVEGVSGRRCDSCGRGYVGTFPECEPCHKCFRDWDTNVGELTNQTQRLMDTVEELKDTGATSPYKDTISSLDDGIKQLRQILDDDKIHQTLKHTQSLRQQAKYETSTDTQTYTVPTLFYSICTSLQVIFLLLVSVRCHHICDGLWTDPCQIWSRYLPINRRPWRI